MRYPAAEKLEIIRLVEGSHLPVRWTLARIGVPATTFYRWYDRYRERGLEGLDDRPPKPGRVWNRIPDPVRERVLALALEVPELSPRELAVRFTDQEKYFVSEASVYRLLKAHDLITCGPSASPFRPAPRRPCRRPQHPSSRSTRTGRRAFPPTTKMSAASAVEA